MSDLYIYSFYRFKNIKNKKTIKLKIEQFISNKVIRGTILIADEGVNGSISGSQDDLSNTIKFIKKLLCIKKIELKINLVEFLPFNKMKIRLKREIVSLGKGVITFSQNKNNFVDPDKWDNFIKQKKIKLIDLRNTYEIDIGNFKSSINPNTKNFREFPNKFKKMNIGKKDIIAMYCTGGIRCEKAAGYLNQKGYRNVYQLKGGIINYFSYLKNKKIKSHWNGECFVFDNRVTINNELKKGNYLQCYGCRSPITKKDTKSKKYNKGVTCHKCYDIRTKDQKERSLNRQLQIYNADLKNENHPFKKIKHL